MGCDIHLRVEKRVNGAWVDGNIYDAQGDVVEFYTGRNYLLFGILAGVRYKHLFGPIAPVRGMPDDATQEHKESFYSIDCHSTTYFTLSELLKAVDKYSVTKHKGMLSEKQVEKLNRYGEKPDSWCAGTTDNTYVQAEWYSSHNSLEHFVNAFSVIADAQYMGYKPDDIRVLITFDN